jgi:hypothetical protein
MLWKKLIITAVVAFALASAAALVVRRLERTESPSSSSVQLPDAVVVLCFHAAIRCPADEQLENYTREVLKKSFAASMEKGTLVLQVLDYESPDNAHLRSVYQVDGTTIVLADARPDGKGVAKNLKPQIDNLDNDKDSLQKLLRDEIENIFKGTLK